MHYEILAALIAGLAIWWMVRRGAG